MQMLSLFITLPSAQPAFPTPQGQALRWAASPQQVEALTITVKAWVATAAKVSGLAGEDLFLALRGAFAAAAARASSVRSLPWSMRFGALLAFLCFAHGSQPLVGGEGSSLAAGACGGGGGSLSPAAGPLAPRFAAPSQLNIHVCRTVATTIIAHNICFVVFHTCLPPALRRGRCRVGVGSAAFGNGVVQLHLLQRALQRFLRRRRKASRIRRSYFPVGRQLDGG